jgi:hypothetical protein
LGRDGGQGGAEQDRNGHERRPLQLFNDCKVAAGAAGSQLNPGQVGCFFVRKIKRKTH